MSYALFNGVWVLDKSRNSNLSPLLEAMGRSRFEVSCVSSADEIFTLELITPKHGHKDVITFHKKVEIYLQDTVLKLFAMFKPSITRIKYENQFLCDGVSRDHPNDSKSFGSCNAVCYITADNHIIIRWYMNDKRRIMISDHFIHSDGNLIVDISISHQGKSTIEVQSRKVYIKKN